MPLTPYAAGSGWFHVHFDPCELYSFGVVSREWVDRAWTAFWEILKAVPELRLVNNVPPHHRPGEYLTVKLVYEILWRQSGGRPVLGTTPQHIDRATSFYQPVVCYASYQSDPVKAGRTCAHEAVHALGCSYPAADGYPWRHDEDPRSVMHVVPGPVLPDRWVANIRANLKRWARNERLSADLLLYRNQPGHVVTIIDPDSVVGNDN